MQSVIQIILNNLYLVGAMALTTTGIALTYKTAKMVNFAQAITATAGVFTAAAVVSRMGGSPWVALIVGVGMCFLMGLFFDAAIIRHASVVGGGKVMVTLGLIIIVTAVIPLVFGMIPYNYIRYFTGNLNFSVFGMDFTVTKNALFILSVAIVVISVIFTALNFTKWGLGIRATASNRQVASMMGINTNKMTALSWAISSACGGLGAILYASQTSIVDVGMLGTVQISSLLSFVIGGYNSFYGPVIGSVIIPVIRSMAALFSGLWSTIILYVIILLAILVKPQGLFGKVSKKKV